MSISKKPILLEIDAPDMAGKTSLIEALKQRPVFFNWNFCRLPGTSKLGEMLRPVVKEMTMKPNTSLGVALAGMSTAYYDMAASAKNTITDRGLSSVITYQFNLDGAQKADPILAEAVFNSLKKQVEADFNYYRLMLLPDFKTILKRKEIRGAESAQDKYDNIDIAGMQKMYEVYDYIANYDEVHFDIEDRTFIIDNSDMSIEDEIDEVLKIISNIAQKENK